jgi:GTP-binding protein
MVPMVPENYQTPYFRGVTYVASYPSPESFPNPDHMPVIAFVGRSNSGKSSLLSALCDHKNLARSSKTAGKTRLLNYFIIPKPVPGRDTTGLFLVDTPGYGHARLSKDERHIIRQMIDNFLLKATGLSLIIVILDARRKIESEELSILSYCDDHEIPLIMARTKWDTMNSAEKKDARSLWKAEGILSVCHPVSSTKKAGIDTLLQKIRDTIFV